ncbi:hypothetical protein [uncultured Dokdonia sp.]|uniref:hypothetical protein n=1 Tax=uncultured Dokdonia sp. TaxID=575653 RepID=UPI0030ECC3A1|tara:strand:+ start:64525 stop:65430 length:906 start_codon:yes stop_codon:yes gene_type:complete
MKKFIKTILIFALIFFIIDKAAYFILVKTSKLQSDKKLEKILEGGMDRELLVLGSSRGIGNLIGEQLENETGLTTYNLSFRGSDITFQEFIFKTYLQYNKAPKKLLLVIDNPSLLALKSTLGFRYDRLYPLAQNDVINNELIELGKHSIASKYVYTLRLQSRQLKFKKIKTSNNWEIDDYGSQVVYGRSPHFEILSSNTNGDYNQEEMPEKIEALANIRKLGDTYGITIYYIFPPNLSGFNTGFLNRFNKIVPVMKNVFIYDMTKDVYRNEDYFYDESHLNHKGARLFTKDVSDFIINNSK